MIKVRPQKITDARRFYEILGNSNFIYFPFQPKSIEEERAWLKENPTRRKNNTAWNYAIVYNKKVIGAIGVHINYHRKYIGEIGYFVEEAYWNKGIATRAVKLLENMCVKMLHLSRVEILMEPANKGSEKVAVKNNYRKEGLLKSILKGKDGSMRDCLLYAKVRS